MADARSCGALMNGIIRQSFYGESEFTNDMLHKQIFPDLSDGAFNSLLNKYRGIVKSMSSSNMDNSQAEVFLGSQAKKKDSGLTEDHTKVLLKTWRNHRDKIHDCLVNKCTWENQLKNMSWRVDVKTQSRITDQINTPTAIVEMVLESRGSTTADDEVVRFEMDDKALNKVLSSLKEIDDQLSKYNSDTTD